MNSFSVASVVCILTHTNQQGNGGKSCALSSDSFLSSSLKATFLSLPLSTAVSFTLRHVFLLRYLNSANYAYFALPISDETILRHFSLGMLQPRLRPYLAPGVSAFARVSSSQFTRVRGNS